MEATSLRAEELQSAFEVFNQQSGLLEQSYRQLQHKVSLLTGQLRRAQSERHAELVEKERLGQRLAHLLETLPGAILVLDGDGVIRECNSDASELLKQPLTGCSWAEIVRREIADGGSEDGNIRLRDGRWLSLSRRPLTNEPGEILLLADVTESRQMGQLRQRQERLTTIGEMTATFAHQVRTPLASALLYVSQFDAQTERQRRAAQKVTERLHDLGRMVNDMLGFAAGTKSVEEPVNVYELLTEAQVSIAPQLDNRTDLRVTVKDASISVAGNKDALKGAILNLVTNACQACDADARVEIVAERVDDYVYLSVVDDGPGIAEDVLPRLFEPFFTTRPQGTGLGLAVVHAVAAAHEGDVMVESSAKGSCFTLRLPAELEDGVGGNDD